MRKEKIILSASAALIGILVAVAGFFFYQSTKKINPDEVKKIAINSPSPTPASSIFITLDRPRDEEVVDERIITVSGKTIPNAKIVVQTQITEEAAIAASNGNFSTEITLEASENIIEVIAVAPNGEIAKVKRIVTYTTESF
ncbi:MAG: hypothetical protein HYW63_02620 [Candidatus Levybacteria bacterium]|nr:hypothetical protein [Candidatus Levybacteria bacterium]